MTEAEDDPIPDILQRFALVDKIRNDAVKADEEFQRVTRRLFTTASGRRWLVLAMARYNFNGSVFSEADGMNPALAAHRDGMRNVLSDILNASFHAQPEEPDDE